MPQKQLAPGYPVERDKNTSPHMYTPTEKYLIDSKQQKLATVSLHEAVETNLLNPRKPSVNLNRQNKPNARTLIPNNPLKSDTEASHADTKNTQYYRNLWITPKVFGVAMPRADLMLERKTFLESINIVLVSGGAPVLQALCYAL